MLEVDDVETTRKAQDLELFHDDRSQGIIRRGLEAIMEPNIWGDSNLGCPIMREYATIIVRANTRM